MGTRSSSVTDAADRLRDRSLDAYHACVQDAKRQEAVDALGRLTSRLWWFVRGYEDISHPSLSPDDEILNWAFSEVPADLCSAAWLLASGYYKASASCLRNAYDISTAALYFQIRENEVFPDGGYNQFFHGWDRGTSDTPNWGKMKPVIANQPSVKQFRLVTGTDIAGVLHDHFHHLCAFSHSRAFTTSMEPVTAINTTGTCPRFDATFFERGCELARGTISLMAVSWHIVFPEIILTEPLGPPAIYPQTDEYDDLFLGQLGRLARQHTYQRPEPPPPPG